jgi:hypothetical protein
VIITLPSHGICSGRETERETEPRAHLASCAGVGQRRAWTSSRTLLPHVQRLRRLFLPFGFFLKSERPCRVARCVRTSSASLAHRRVEPSRAGPGLANLLISLASSEQFSLLVKNPMNGTDLVQRHRWRVNHLSEGVSERSRIAKTSTASGAGSNEQDEFQKVEQGARDRI